MEPEGNTPQYLMPEQLDGYLLPLWQNKSPFDILARSRTQAIPLAHFKERGERRRE